MMNDIIIYCRSCNFPMIEESNSKGDNVSIYYCELCKHEVKLIHIGKKQVSV